MHTNDVAAELAAELELSREEISSVVLELDAREAEEPCFWCEGDGWLTCPECDGEGCPRCYFVGAYDCGCQR